MEQRRQLRSRQQSEWLLSQIERLQPIQFGQALAVIV